MLDLNAPVPAEFVMAVGLGMCALGFITSMFWWTFGGFLLFLMGVMALEPLPETKEGMAGGLQKQGDANR